jgi:hypothetical protein
VTKQAHLPDGTVLEFPDDTPDAVMDRVVKSHVAPHNTANDSDFARMVSGAPKEPSATDSWLRAGGLWLRSAGEGAANTLGMVGDPIIATENKLLGRQDYGLRGAVDWGMDKLGLPTPQNGTERVQSAITQGAVGSGGFIGLGRLAAGTALPPLARAIGASMAAAPGTQIASGVTGAASAQGAQEAGAGPGGQMAAGLAGAFVPAAAMTVVPMAVRGAIRGGEPGRAQVEQSVNDFRRAGATPSVGQATGNKRTQGLESLLAGAPTSSGVMGRFAENQADKIGAGLQQRSEDFFPNASAERAGKAVERGVTGPGGFMDDIKATRAKLYADADAAIPPQTVLPLSNTRAALRGLTAPPAGAANTGKTLTNPRIVALAQAIDKDILASAHAQRGSVAWTGQGRGIGLTYTAVKALRSRIGEELADFSLSADRPTAEYKRLYAALSADMEAAAQSQGPAAVAAMKRANGFYRASADRIGQLERVIDKNGGPEKVYAAVMSGTQDGGTTLRAVMQSLPPEGQKAITAAVIKRMGLATKGQQNATGEQFSAQTFLTNWNGVSKEAKRALFNRYGPKFANDMDQIARVADRIRTGSKVYANPSGTANKGAAYAYLGSLAGAAATGSVDTLTGLLVGGAMANLTARAFTNPRFVEWLARSTKIPVSALPQHILVLKGIAKNDPELQAYADALAKQREAQQ